MFRLAQEEKKELITNCDRYVLRLKSRLWRDAPRGPEARSLSEALSVSLMAGPDRRGQ